MRAAFSQQELDQMLAPIALYPDPLLSQVFMAATYPLEVVQAARWSRANPDFKGDDAVRSVEQQAWDPSVKSLVAFPQLLAMMDENIGWMERLGNAFLGQQVQVSQSVQNLRQKASASGNLASNEQQRVQQQDGYIVVEPANPQVIYVPYYNPTVVYGPWWWPGYPPVYWRAPVGYYVRPGVFSGFYWGPGIVISSGFFFGGFDWHRHTTYVVNVNPYYYRYGRPPGVVYAPGAWQHDVAHRRGVAYRDEAVRRQYSHPVQPIARTDAPARVDSRGQSPSPSMQRPAAAAVPVAKPAESHPGHGAEKGEERGGERQHQENQNDRGRQPMRYHLYNPPAQVVHAAVNAPAARPYGSYNAYSSNSSYNAPVTRSAWPAPATQTARRPYVTPASSFVPHQSPNAHSAPAVTANARVAVAQHGNGNVTTISGSNHDGRR